MMLRQLVKIARTAVLHASICIFIPFIASATITNPYRTDGFGAQFQTIIYSLIYAEVNGIPFVYTPFQSIEHNYINDPDFLRKKEELINLIDHLPRCHDVNYQKNFGITGFIDFFENNLKRCGASESLKKVKELFRANKDPSKFTDPLHLTIAVHIRRKNPHDNRIMGTDSSDLTYINVINNLRGLYHFARPIFHIYSQGDVEQFKTVFAGDDIVLHIDETLEDTFTAMVFADVLVTSTSSFSYTAALLSDGEIYYIPFWHPPLGDWIIISD